MKSLLLWVALHVKPGDAVLKRAPLLVIEAMKMEHTVAARAAGTVAAVTVDLGAQVTLGQALMRIDN